jgi:hypothetical protein
MRDIYVHQLFIICSFTLSLNCFLKLILLPFVHIMFVGKSEPAAEVQMCRNGIGPKCFLVLLRYVSQVEGFFLYVMQV